MTRPDDPEQAFNELVGGPAEPKNRRWLVVAFVFGVLFWICAGLAAWGVWASWE